MIEYSDIIDISLPLKEGMINFPNNPPFLRTEENIQTRIISTLTMGSHTGTHIDAPRHAIEGGTPVDQSSLHHFIGPCRVLDMTHAVGQLTADQLSLEPIHAGERILLKTQNSIRGFDAFYNNYVSLTPDAAAWLGEQGVLLVGIDSLSIKARESRDDRPHTELLQRDVPIVEGLDLSNVEPGVYSISVLPLRIEGGDGAPARAVLLH